MWSFPSLAGDVLVDVLLADTSVIAAVMMGQVALSSTCW